MKPRQHAGGASFDRVANVYRLLETIAFGPFLQRARVAFLKQIDDAEEILLAGEGNGLFLAALLEVNCRCRVTCVDKSQTMLRLARNRIHPSDRKRVRFEQADLTDSLLPTARYDGVVTHFFLDCFSDRTLVRLLKELEQALIPKGVLLLADFEQPVNKGALSLFQRHALRFLYSFFKSICGIEAHELCNPKELLFSLGMRETKRKTYLQGWIASLVYEKTIAGKPLRNTIQSSATSSQKALTMLG